jgi:hypothetical protein
MSKHQDHDYRHHDGDQKQKRLLGIPCSLLARPRTTSTVTSAWMTILQTLTATPTRN